MNTPKPLLLHKSKDHKQSDHNHMISTEGMNVNTDSENDAIIIVHSTCTVGGKEINNSQVELSSQEDNSPVNKISEPKQMIFGEQITVTAKSREGGDTATNKEAMVLNRAGKPISSGE